MRLVIQKFFLQLTGRKESPVRIIKEICLSKTGLEKKIEPFSHSPVIPFVGGFYDGEIDNELPGLLPLQKRVKRARNYTTAQTWSSL